MSILTKPHRPRRPAAVPTACVAAAILLASTLPARAGNPADWQRHPIVTAPFMEKAPAIDGVVNRAEWQAAAQLGPFKIWPDAVDDGLQRNVYIGYDDTNLYIAFRLQRPAGAPGEYLMRYDVSLKGKTEIYGSFHHNAGRKRILLVVSNYEKEPIGELLVKLDLAKLGLRTPVYAEDTVFLPVRTGWQTKTGRFLIATAEPQKVEVRSISLRKAAE